MTLKARQRVTALNGRLHTQNKLDGAARAALTSTNANRKDMDVLRQRLTVKGG